MKRAIQSLTRKITRTLYIQTEVTPNEDSLKFIPGSLVMKNGATKEFLTRREGMKSPLANKLFNVEGVETIFYGPDFITINKSPEMKWGVIKPEIFSILMDHFSVEQPLFIEEEQNAKDTNIEDGDTEIVQLIKELIETRIRPSIQEDGGDLEYLGFVEKTGTVQLKLMGACRTCDSSIFTLKNGIQNMLMHYIPEVKEVQQIADEIEQMGSKVFEAVDKKIEK